MIRDRDWDGGFSETRTATCDEHAHGRRRTRDGGARSEEEDGGEEDALAAEDVREAAAHGEHGSAGERVRVGDPYEGVCAVEIMDDGRERRRDRGLETDTDGKRRRNQRVGAEAGGDLLDQAR